MKSTTYSYSVIVRTLGTAGEKYKALLDSVKSQTLPAAEVVVAIPEGYEPDCHIRGERIVRCPKGMVSQRAAGIDAAATEWILVVDDDIEFAPDFVQKLCDFAVKWNLDCVLPMEGDPESAAESEVYVGMPWKIRLRGLMTGQICVSKEDGPYLDKVTASAGRKLYAGIKDPDKCYLCQLGCFQCFLIKTEVAKMVRFGDELWLEDGTVTKYAAYDDPTFFYKLFLQGGVTGISVGIRFHHLDATAGRRVRTKLEDKIIRYYSTARNRTIFWHRFLWGYNRSFKNFLGYLYGFTGYTLWTVAINLNPKNWKALGALFKGYADAAEVIRKNRHL